MAHENDDVNYTTVNLFSANLSKFIGSGCNNLTASSSNDITNRINLVVPYLFVLGILGNGLSILTFSQRKLRRLSCGCYLLLLAISDTIGLLVISRPYFFTKLNIAHHLNSSFLCALQLFLTKVFDELTPWLLVFVASNRLFLSRYPRHRHCFQTSRWALTSSFILLIIIIFINSHLLFGIGVGYTSSNRCHSVCGPTTQSLAYVFFYKNISPIIDLLFSLIIPFCIVFIANIFIIVNVRRVKKRVVRVRRNRRATRNARLSVVLLADLITFLIVSLPVLLCECIYHFTRTINQNKLFDYYLHIVWSISTKIFYLNYSLSFYFYVLASSYFRHHFLLAIRCKSLHDFIFKVRNKKKSRQSFQTTDFTTMNRTSHGSVSSKFLMKPYELNMIRQIQLHPDITVHNPTVIHDSLALSVNHHKSVAASDL